MKRNHLVLCLLVVTLSLGLGVGCAKKSNDAGMTAEIQSRFAHDSALGAKQLSVEADNGVVTLSGSVDNDAQRDAAGKQAAAVNGVKTVINNLQVASATAPADAMPAVTPSPTPTPSQETAPTDAMAAAAPTAAPSTSPAPDNPAPSAPRRSSKSGKTKSGASQNSGSTQMAANTPAPAAAASAPAPVDNTPPPPPPPPPPKKFIIDQGTQLTVRLVDPIDSEKNLTGDTFHATLNAPLTSDGEEAVPAGVEVTGHLVEVKSASRFAGQSAVVLQLDSIKSGSRTYNLQTDQYTKKGSSRGKNTAEKVGGGAVLGGIIGALAGGGKGAAIGATAGAGVGGGVQAATKVQQIKLPSETVLNFTLQSPVTVVQAQSGDANRQKLGDSQ